MVILALDTTGEHCKLAILRRGETFIKTSPADRRQIEVVFPLLDELLKSANIEREDIGAVAIPIGPGSFTGIRLGATISRALAAVLKTEIIGVSSLKAIAATASRKTGRNKIVVANDAKREQIYFGAYVFQDRGDYIETVSEDTMLSPSDARFPTGDDWVIAGNAWLRYKGQFSENQQDHFYTGVTESEIRDIVQLALLEIRRGGKNFQTEPVYFTSPIN